MSAARAVLIQPQNVICRHVVILAQGNEMAQRQLIGAALIAGIHGLGGPQNGRNLGLCQIGVWLVLTDRRLI